MKQSGIYKITNTLNGKVYVGSSINIKHRWKEHMCLLINKKHSKKLQNSWNKYGIDKFVFEVIEECGIEELISREQYWIDTLNSYKKGYNSRPIAESNLGIKHSEESKKKMSESHKGLNTWSKGIKLSEETKLKISINHSKHNLGKKASEEHIKKLIKSHLGKKASKETKKKMSEAHKGLNTWQKGRKASEETKAKMRESQIKRRLIETIIK